MMQIAPEIVFEGMERSPAIETAIATEIAKLESLNRRMTMCRVVFSAPHRHHHKGKLYTVRIHIGVPGAAEIVASRSHDHDHSHEDPYVAIRDSFASARRQLKALRDKQVRAEHASPKP